MTVRLPRPLWFAIPTVLLVVAMVGLWVGVPIYRQHIAIATIERLGGVCITDDIGPQWLRGWVGEARMKPFDTVTDVILLESDVSDADLGVICTIADVEGIDVKDTSITDTGLEYLGRVRNLRYLRLDRTQLTDDGLSHLKGLSKLQQLELNSTRITDKGLMFLQEMRSLKALYINDTHVTDTGVAELQKALPDLRIER